MAESVEDRVRKVVVDLLKVPAEKVARESEFGVEIDEDEVAENVTVAQAVDHMTKVIG